MGNNIIIPEESLYQVAATWDRRTAVQTLEDPTGMVIARFTFDPAYETSTGIVFDSAMVWYTPVGVVHLVKRGLVASMQRACASLVSMLTPRRS